MRIVQKVQQKTFHVFQQKKIFTELLLNQKFSMEKQKNEKDNAL